MKLWGILRSKQKIIASHVSEIPERNGPYPPEWLHDAIGEICSTLDIARPVVLEKHANDFSRFSRVIFKKDDFIEKVAFDQLEIELIDSDRKSKESQAFIDD